MKQVNFLEYALCDGYIDNWLVAGPQAVPLDGWPEDRFQVAAGTFGGDYGLTQTPVDGEAFQLAGADVRWKYYRCLIDHLVHAPVLCATPQVLSTWGYARVKSAAAQTVTVTLTASVPVDLWINKQRAYRAGQYPAAYLESQSFPVALQQGENEILVRTADACAECSATRFALRLAAPDLRVVLPTYAAQPERQKRLERILEHAYLEDVVNHRGAHFNLRWAEGVEPDAIVAYQIQDAKERIYVDGKDDVGKVTDVGQEYRLYERPYWVVLKATDVEYYEQDLRYQRALPIHVLDTAFSPQPYGSFHERLAEALKDATKHEALLYAQIARMALAQWEKVDAQVVLAAAARVARRETGCLADLLGLLLVLYRYTGDAAFPKALKQPLEACVRAFDYAAPLTGDGDQILALAGELLAGQRFPETSFTASGQAGAWHKARAEDALQSWMLQRGKTGFAAWDSQGEFERIVAALAQLATLTENEALRDLAAVLLDKVFFTMAVNSFKGAYAGTHGKADAGMLKSAQLEATSGLMSVMWGMGVFNHHIIGTVSVACSTYEFPLLIGDIAADLSVEMLNRERHQLADGEVNKVTYRTLDYLLSSVQDYRPGQPGDREHIWQASFGPDALVFATHPACMSEHPANCPGFWLGNAVLPRVAQWKDVLVSIHKLPDDDWMGFTHAYFPIYSFEEYAIDGQWAFARMGDGYLALGAACGLDWITGAPDGHRELRSYGKHNVWLCHMGRAVQDGSFTDFQQKIKAMPLAWEGLAVAFTSLRGEAIRFGWQEPLQVDGREELLSGFRHYENPYCRADFPAGRMEIGFQDIAVRLNFE
ncbi:MAG: hypothetical protein ACOYYS_24995 [Chloroflexota bacterium]